VIIVAVEKQQALNVMSVCQYFRLSYPACKSRLSCVVWFAICGPPDSTIFFPHYLIRGM